MQLAHSNPTAKFHSIFTYSTDPSDQLVATGQLLDPFNQLDLTPRSAAAVEAICKAASRCKPSFLPYKSLIQ